jgi:hypothetical protein
VLILRRGFKGGWFRAGLRFKDSRVQGSKPPSLQGFKVQEPGDGIP